MPEENTEENKDVTMVTDNTNDILKDPFSADIINNEYKFSQTLAVHSGAIRSLAF